MGGRTALRWLIDALEARYALLADGRTPSLEGPAMAHDKGGVPLSSKEEEQLRRVADSLSELLSVVQSEIAEHEAAVKRIQNSSRCATNVPVEVLGRIFEYACFEPARSWNRDGRSRRQNRAAICSTCSRWRKVAISNTLLWNCIMIAEPYYKEASYYAERAFKELLHAGSRPIALLLHARSVWLDQNVMAPIYSLPCSYETLVLCVYTNVLQSIAPLYASPGFANLREFVLNWGSGSRPGPIDAKNPDLIIDLKSMTSLHDLSVLCDFSETRRFAQIRALPVCSITRLFLDGSVDATSCVALIVSCPDLTMLDWHSEYQQPLDTNREFGSHQHLLSLLLSGAGPATLVNHLHAPSLVRLAIFLYVEEDDPFWEPHTKPPEFPNLRFLQVGDCFFSAIVPFIALHPTIEDLVMETYKEPSLEHLDFSRPPIILPNLRNLSLTWLDGELGMIQELLERRAEVTSHLPPFSLFLEPSMDGSVIFEDAGPVRLKFGFYDDGHNWDWQSDIVWPQ